MLTGHAPVHAAEDAVVLFAAGSLRNALAAVAQAYTAEQGVQVKTVFGPSGVLRERLSKGEPAGVFASANMEHPTALNAEGKAGAVRMFARNRLCAFTRPGLTLTSDRVLDTMLDPAVRLGTSTPKADPSGDYAWEVFRKADAIRPGAKAALEAKALKLVGAADSPQPPQGRNAYAWHMQEKRADMALGYCTGGRDVMKELPGASVVPLPSALATGADYGLTVMKHGGSPAAEDFARFILSAKGRAILTEYGFELP